MRELIIDTIGEIGGHFGANLGACEIAVALHSLLDSPTRQDPLGRRPPGLPAQGADRPPRPAAHDPQVRRARAVLRDPRVGARHHGRRATPRPRCPTRSASRRRCGAAPGTDGRVVAVIGDGALTGGVSFEALLNAGGMDMPIVIVVNDNGMSIAPNVGALSRYFNRMRLNPKLYHAREDVEETLTRLPAGIGKRIERLGPILKESLKAFWAPGLFFEELDLAYVGVIDGHDVKALRQAIGEALEADRPVVVHCKTVKGKGFVPGRGGRPRGHGEVARRQARARSRTAPWPRRRRRSASPSSPAPPQYTTVFGEALVEECRRDERVVGITAAMNSGTGLNILQRELPERYYDVGIAEQHAVLFAAGLALQGAKPVAAIYSTFLQRALRPDRPRRLPAEAQRGVRDGPRRAGRRRRPDPPRRLRHLLHALPAEPGADGAARRGDARAHAAHGARLRRRPGRAALPARRGRGGAAAARSRSRSRSAAASCCARASGWRCSATATACRWRSARPTCWRTSTASSRPWPTPASPSRSTASWSSGWPPSTTCS